MARRHFVPDPLPPSLLFDTSFLIDVAVETQPRHARAGEFLARVSATETECYYSYLAFAEFLNGTARLFLQTEEHMSEDEAQDELRLHGPQLVADHVGPALDKLDDLIGYTNAVLVRVDGGVWALARAISLQHGLQPYDAIHAASAQYVHCADVVSFDTVFDRLAELNRWAI